MTINANIICEENAQVITPQKFILSMELIIFIDVSRRFRPLYSSSIDKK